MGQALSSETHSISGGDGYRYWVGLNMKAFRGCKKTIYKGILLGSGPRWGENVVVKSFSSISGTRENWIYEVVKADVTRQMISMYNESCHDSPSIRIVNPSIVQMDKVSKVNKWLNERKGNTTISQDDWVSVEEYVSGEFRRFSPWTTVHEKRPRREADDLSAFSHFVYAKSQGNFVACDFQGVIDEENGKLTYTITDSIIHSMQKEYGPFDEGEFGITEFFKLHKCNQVCRVWPVPQPLTPPPEFSALPLTPPPAFEDIVFPTPRSSGIQHTDPWRRPASARGPRRRHFTGDGEVTEPPQIQIRTCQTSSNVLSLCNNPSDLEGPFVRGRSNSTTYSTSATLQRPRLHSERLTHERQQNMTNLVIPSCPPAYEDCVNFYGGPT